MPKQCCIDMWDLKIAADEPVFILRGQDTMAPDVISEWIRLALLAGVNPDKVQRAREHFVDMIKFQQEHPERIKLPD